MGRSIFIAHCCARHARKRRPSVIYSNISEEDLEDITLPQGIEFLHIAGQRIFPDNRVPDGASIYLIRRGDKDNHPSVFDGGVLEFGFHDLDNGWAIFGIPLKSDETTIEIKRKIEANIPAIEG